MSQPRLIEPSRGSGEVLAQLLPHRWSAWQWGVAVHPVTLDVRPVMWCRLGVQPLPDN
jgi:hypothetical protein